MRIYRWYVSLLYLFVGEMSAGLSREVLVYNPQGVFTRGVF